MNIVQRYELDFEKTYPFFVDHLDWGTPVSMKLVESINFKERRFFTFLPDVADFSKLHDFKHAGMLPQYKAVKFPGKSGIFVPVPNIHPAICEYIQQFLSGFNNRMVFFEYFDANPKSQNLARKGAMLSLVVTM